MKRTPLNEVHKQLKARMIEFVGWEMPVQYESALQEHLAVRTALGLFDVSHMGRFRVKGPGSVELIQEVTCNDAARLSDGQAQYSAFLTPEGGFLDDIVVYRLFRDEFLICVNASNLLRDLQFLLHHRRGKVEVADESENSAQIAVQGPKAEAILQSMTEMPLEQIKYYWFKMARIGQVEALVARTGYTGEDGFELYLPAEAAAQIWMEILDRGREEGARPAGLAARNTLRLEMRYPLYGNDIDETTTPWEAGLGWIVKLNKGQFVGRSSLEQQKQTGPSRRLSGFELLDRGIARDHCPVILDDRRIGQITSGSYSPSLDKSIGLAYLPLESSSPGTRFHVDVRGKLLQAQVVETPFYRRK
jgi:aminomethyltransferase